MTPKCYRKSAAEGFCHWIYTACTSWENFHESLVERKIILERNQYLEEFDKLIINDKKIATSDLKKINLDNNDVAPKLKMRIQYQGFLTSNYINQIKGSGAPIQPV